MLVALLWACTILLLFIFRGKNAEQGNQIAKVARRIWILFVVLGVVGTIGILIDANSGNHAAIWEPYQNILVFSDSWGTGRGLNWQFLKEAHRVWAGYLLHHHDGSLQEANAGSGLWLLRFSA